MAGLGVIPRGRSRGERGVAGGTGRTAARVQTRTPGAVRLLRAGHSSGAFLNGISVSEIHEEPSFTGGETEASRGSATGPGACWQHVPEPDPSACLSDSEVWASPPSWSSLSVAGREVCPSDSPEAERERAWGLQRSWSWVSLLGSTRSDSTCAGRGTRPARGWDSTETVSYHLALPETRRLAGEPDPLAITSRPRDHYLR